MSCADCARPYGDEHGFPDLIIPFWAWKEISPTGDDGGLLCPSCICKRLHHKGIRCEGSFMSGPIISVSGPTMNVLRRVENIELAIEGRHNRWSGVREMVRDSETASGDHRDPNLFRRIAAWWQTRGGQLCWDCGAAIIAADDGAMVCVQCGGRNRRVGHRVGSNPPPPVGTKPLPPHGPPLRTDRVDGDGRYAGPG